MQVSTKVAIAVHEQVPKELHRLGEQPLATVFIQQDLQGKANDIREPKDKHPGFGDKPE